MSSALRIHDMQKNDRPRERLMERGADALRDAELVAILLRSGVRGASAIQVAENLLQRFGSLQELARAPIDQLRMKGIGRDKAIALKAAFTLARRMAEELRDESAPLDEPARVASLVREEMSNHEVEHFKVILLNARYRLIRIESIADGLLDQVLAHPREVFRAAIAGNAHSIILVHNHPSGDPQPSEGDIRVTRDLIRAGQLLKIPVLDHLIIGRKSSTRPQDYASLRELGYFYG